MVDHIVPPYRALMESYDKAQSGKRSGGKRSDLLDAAASRRLYLEFGIHRGVFGPMGRRRPCVCLLHLGTHSMQQCNTLSSFFMEEIGTCIRRRDKREGHFHGAYPAETPKGRQPASNERSNVRQKATASSAVWTVTGLATASPWHALCYPNLGTVLSPFLLLDYAGPMEFAPTDERRGVGEHPHRGFETVTIVYEGEVEHRDSSGGGGKIGPGDVQWMTAASGLVHEEFHGREFAQRGGMFEMVQLWVNLPARDKMTPPRYQGIVSSQIPTRPLPGGHGVVRVIDGRFVRGAKGPAHTHAHAGVGPPSRH